MLYIKIKENSSAARAFIEYIKTLSFVEIIDTPEENPILGEIEEGLKEVKAMQQGTQPRKSLNDLLNG